jgi:hypothetical protein
MISFRFHIVSLAAVFMALALGVVLGTAFINDGIVNRLESDVKNLRAERNTARGELSQWRKYGNDSEEALVESRLEGVRVLTIVPDGLPGAITDKLRSLLATAGAMDAGVVTLDRAWGEEEPPTDDIAATLGIVGPISIESVTNEAADRLAREFAAGGGQTLGALVEASLARYDAGDAAAAPGGPARFVVIDHGTPSGLLEPLTRALVAQVPSGVLVADAEADELVDDSLVGILRRDPQGGSFSTVDHFDTAPGRVAAILALRDFGRAATGHYGTCCGANRAAPSGA